MKRKRKPIILIIFATQNPPMKDTMITMINRIHQRQSTCHWQLIMTIILLATSLNVAAEDFIYDGIAYQILPNESSSVEVTRSEDITYSGTITIPAKITYSSNTYQVKGIGDGAFLCCDKLLSVSLPNSCQQISDRAFYGCTSLKEIQFGNNLETIGNYSFHDCKSLTSITLPETIKSIGRACFKNCIGLRNIYVNAINPPVLSETAFLHSYNGTMKDQIVVYVPTGKADAYRNSNEWSTFTHIIDQSDNNNVLFSTIVEGDGKIVYNDHDYDKSETFPIISGSSITLQIKEGNDYSLSRLTLNDEDILPQVANNTIQIGPINQNMVLKAIFEKRKAYLTLCHNKNGNLQIDINEGQTVNLKINANDGWQIYSVTIDNEDVTSQVDKDNCIKIPKAKSGMSIRVVLEKNGQFSIWNADGVQTNCNIENPIIIPENALAADLTDILTPTVIPNANPNTIFLADNGTVMEEKLKGNNVVCDGYAKSIHLYDGNDVFIPYDIEAEEIEYHRFSPTNTGQKYSWETIFLPFSVDYITTSEGNEEIDWFRDKNDKDKDFWLCEWESTSDEGLQFNYANQWNANQPYLMAIPFTEYGTPHHLQDKELTFHAYNKTLYHTEKAVQEMSPYSFHGILAKAELNDVYTLNAEKGIFELQAREEIDAFRAYFKNNQQDKPMSLPISGIADDIKNFNNDDISTINKNAVNPIIQQTYNLKGMRLTKEASSTHHGIIIQNKKKHVIK